MIVANPVDATHGFNADTDTVTFYGLISHR